nr:MerR family transcriptional regulator [Tissierella sp.]
MFKKKGLISPKRDNENDYRSFKESDLIKLQTILMYRELNLPIEKIKEIFKDDSKNNILDHFYTQWDVVNSEIHKIKLIQDSLENIMDTIYESDGANYQQKIVEHIESMNKVWKIKNEWWDRWNFDSWAKTYDKSVKKDISGLKFYKNYDNLLDQVFEKAIKDKEDNMKILEIGVGTGNLAKRFLDKDYDIIGIDQSREMLNQAKEKFPSLIVRLGDFLNIPYGDNKFDVLVSTYAFHHLNEDEKVIAINEMLRVTKSEGKIIIGDIMFESEEKKQARINISNKEEVEEIEDEYFSNIDLLKKEFQKHNKQVEVTRIDELIFIVEAK